jgi:hypothetical protein
MTEPQIARHVWDGTGPSGVVQFTAMADGTAQECAVLDQYEQAYAAGLPERIMDAWSPEVVGPAGERRA